MDAARCAPGKGARRNMEAATGACEVGARAKGDPGRDTREAARCAPGKGARRRRLQGWGARWLSSSRRGCGEITKMFWLALFIFSLAAAAARPPLLLTGAEPEHSLPPPLRGQTLPREPHPAQVSCGCARVKGGG